MGRTAVPYPYCWWDRKRATSPKALALQNFHSQEVFPICPKNRKGKKQDEDKSKPPFHL
jgi:hypothetical protein